MKNAFYYVSVLIIILALGGLVVSIYWSSYPYDPYTFSKEPIPVFPETNINPGGFAILQFDYCKNVGGYQEVNKFLVNDKIKIELPTDKGNTPKGCGKVDVPVPIPKITQPGKYWIEYEVDVKVNPIRTFKEEFRSEEFEIT